AGGLILGGLLFLWAWGTRRTAPRPGWKGASGAGQLPEPGAPASSGRRTLAWLLCWIGASGLAWVWLPAGLLDLSRWPLAAACGIALWWYLTPRGHRSGGSTRASGIARPPAPSPPTDALPPTEGA